MKQPTRKSVISRAWEINGMLNNLRAKIEKLTDEIQQVEDSEDFDNFSLRAMRQTLEDLAAFDLEDSIITAE